MIIKNWNVITIIYSLALPDRFFPFFFEVAERKTEKSGLATQDYVITTGDSMNYISAIHGRNMHF